MTGTSTKVALLVLGLLLAGGCVSQGQYDALSIKERRAQEQIIELQEKIAGLEANIEAIRLSKVNDPEARAMLEKLMQEKAALAAALSDAEKALRGGTGIAQIDNLPLPTELDSALRQLASNNPELMEYDSKRGMVKLRSDLTFALGSTEINANGQAALAKLADIINSPIAQRYGVRIVGHTDNVPVTNANNVRQFRDNWGLSAFRAIAVKDVLQKQGVSPTRQEVAGRGEFQPVVANGPKGAAANRRVEIFLVSTGEGAVADAGVPAAAPTATPVRPTTPGASTKIEEDPARFK